MSYSETIDNINNRIENIISDRLPQTYQHITIEPSDYNPTIDDTITVTITVTDQADSPVSGFTVPLQINGESVTGLVTNSSGVATYTYTCDEWGTIKFAVKSYTTFINVTGFKSKNMWNGTLYYDNEKVEYVLDYQGSGSYSASSWTDSSAFDTVPSELRPKAQVYSSLADTRMTVRVNAGTGKLQYVTGGTSISNPSFYAILTWYLP